MTTKRIATMTYLDPPQKAALKRLSDVTRVPMQVYLREALDDLLAKYAKVLRRKEAKR